MGDYSRDLYGNEYRPDGGSAISNQPKTTPQVSPGGATHMTQTAHTPGPWAYDRESGNIYFNDGDIQPTIATVQFEGTSDEQAEADGHLLAAAPEMLEFIQQIFNGLDTGAVTFETHSDETLENVLRRGRAVRAKATGAA